VPLIVSEIADRILPPHATAADRATTIERLRYWTREGLLDTAGDQNPGTGRRRLYDDAVIYDAAVLDALARQGFPVGRERFLTIAMRLISMAKDEWRKKTDKTLFLEVADFTDPNPQGGTRAVFLHKGHAGLVHPRSDVSIVLNLSRIFRRVERK